jgi:hypothetical protein
MTSSLLSVTKKPAPSTTKANTAATTTKAVKTIAASRPVKASELPGSDGTIVNILFMKLKIPVYSHTYDYMQTT